MTTEVVNVRGYQREQYAYIGRPGPFGNPFTIGIHGGRETVVSKFEEYFHERLANDPAFAAEVRSLKGKRLGCFCKPLACHGDVIAEYLEGTDS